MEDPAGNSSLNITELDSTSVLVWYYINGMGGLIIALAGIPGNVTAAIVLLLPAMRNSTSVLLVVMAAYDTLFLVLHVLLQSLPLVFMTNDVCEGYLVITEFLFKYFYTLVHISHTGTIYMTVLVTVERAMVVLFPLKAKHMCNKGRAGLASVAVLLWSVLYNIPRCLEYSNESDEAQKITQYSVTKSPFGRSHFYNVVYLIYLNSLFHFILPVGLIIILNILMVHRVSASRERSVRLVNSRGDSQTRLTIMIIALTAIFCMCRLLTALELILYPAVSISEVSLEQAHVNCLIACSVISAVAETSTLLNSATNFIVYSIFGRKFRRYLRTICCYCCYYKAKGHRGFPFFSSSFSRRLRSQSSTTMTHVAGKTSLKRSASELSACESRRSHRLQDQVKTHDQPSNCQLTSPV